MSRPLGAIERIGHHAGEVERRRGLTARELREEYLRPRKPVVLQGCMDDWRGLHEWSLDGLAERCGDVEVNVGRLFKKTGTMPLREYVDYVHAWRAENDDERPDELPLYADGCMVDDLPGISDDFTMPPCITELDWFERFLPKNPIGHGYLLIGPKGSTTKIHIDGQYTHAFVAQFVGRKRWTVVPFEQLKPFFKNGYFDYIAEWPGLEPEGLEDWAPLKDVDYYTAVLEPGEIIVAPSAQFHEVVNLDDSIALSSNFMESSNARSVIWGLVLAKLGLRKAPDERYA